VTAAANEGSHVGHVVARLRSRVEAVTAALLAHGLSKRFGTTVAVADVDLTLAPGEVRGLLGPNGAGKTTLLRMLLGLIEPDAGTASLLGHSLDELGTRALHSVGGFVEDPCFYPYLSARQNLGLLTQLDGRRGAAASGAIDESLEQVDLAGRADDRVGAFSTGMRQRLGIAAALIRAPRLLLLDEPTSGLDPAGARAVAQLVSDLATDGVAILLSSHQIGELERVCSDYSVMRAGRLVWSGSAAQLEAEAPPSAYTLHTSDDARALTLAGADDLAAEPGLRGGLTVMARPEALDGLVAQLGEGQVLIRRLEWLVSPLESMFFALTSEGSGELAPGAFAERILAQR
jgi:ABC-2 type transport system ATP-binding protein